jgi:hypothetical protein
MIDESTRWEERTMLTATTTLRDEIKTYMHEDGDGVVWSNCQDCGRSVHEDYAATHDEFCPKCYRAAALAEARDDVTNARDELETLMDEMKELRERIGEARAALGDARRRLAELKGR